MLLLSTGRGWGEGSFQVWRIARRWVKRRLRSKQVLARGNALEHRESLEWNMGREFLHILTIPSVIFQDLSYIQL